MPQKNSKNTFNSFKVKGEDLLKQVNELLHEGNVRKILIKDEKGKKTFVEIPVTIGVIGTLIAPVLAAVGALAAMVGIVTVEVINEENSKNNKKTSPEKSKKSTKKIAKNKPKRK